MPSGFSVIDRTPSPPDGTKIEASEPRKPSSFQRYRNVSSAEAGDASAQSTNARTARADERPRIATMIRDRSRAFGPIRVRELPGNRSTVPRGGGTGG